VAEGGRLVAPVGGSGSSPAAGRPIPLGDTGATLARMGRGELIEVPDGLDDVGWSQVIRDVPVVGPLGEARQSLEAQLLQAASAGPNTGIPSLPWLLGAIVAFAVVVGPVNFAVLSRLRRRDLAWVTIPAISLLAVGAFWVAGRQRLEAVILHHGTVVVGGDHNLVGRSALVMVTGASADRRLDFPDGWIAYPSNLNPQVTLPGMGGAPGTVQVEGNRLTFDLGRLGAAAAQVVWPMAGALLPDLSWEAGGEDSASLHVTNHDLEFWAWGVMGGSVVLGEGPLGPGQEGTVIISDRPGTESFGVSALVDVVLASFDDDLWNEVGPLAQAAAWLVSDPLGDTTYFFGFTHDLEMPVTLDGGARGVEGSTLVVLQVPGAQVGGWAGAELVDLGDAGFIDRGGLSFGVITDQITVRYLLPEGLVTDPQLEYLPGAAERPGRLAAYDWATGEFVEVKLEEPLDLARFSSVGGEVMVRLQAGVDGFVEGYLSSASVRLRWESA
ncbi:MAG: hypothetical protein ACRDVM_04685, partial [Acidimicrobiia bacterium]